MNTLPTELLHLISSTNPTTYRLLYQCSKIFHQNEDKMKQLFTQTYIYVTTEYKYTYTALPNGDLHSINDQPALINEILSNVNKISTDKVPEFAREYKKYLRLKWYKNGKNIEIMIYPRLFVLM